MTKIKESSTNYANKTLLNETCSEIYAINLISGQWILSIIYHLKNNRLRFSDLKQQIPSISDKMLAAQLKKMEKSNLIKRSVFPEVPVRVEYELSAIALAFLPILKELETWGNLHKNYHP
ncbi:winged helix-turn-helix transcriptional regulator [Sphingobacterium sp. HJSM2_6]|uniref:winged helix-turn-helix transcriptional regulator n=1 Tax=Sphingobacterium sp. HJSM2_6 TaxID=3366264 RepID=UPI003BC1480A